MSFKFNLILKNHIMNEFIKTLRTMIIDDMMNNENICNYKIKSNASKSS